MSSRCFVYPRQSEGLPSCKFSLRLALMILILLVPRMARTQECSHSTSDISIHPPIALVQDAAGSTVFSFDNVPAVDTALKLTAGPFVNQTTQGIVSGAGVVFAAGDGSGELPKAFSHTANPPVLATISNENAFGVAIANVYNGGRCVGQLKAIRFQAPFNFTLEGDGSASSPLRIQDGLEVRVTLRNNDDLAYAITPVLYFEAEESVAPEVTVGPNSTAVVRFKTQCKWFDLRTWLRTDPSTGHLELRPAARVFGDALGNRVISGRIIPVNAELAYFAPVTSQFISTSIVFVVVLLGGLASLAADSLLPITLKKLSYKKRLRTLADATSAISVKVDSRLRVLLRLERNRLLKLLTSSNALAADTADIFQQVDTGIAALTNRIAVAQRLDELRNRFDIVSLSCPPSVSDKTDQHLQEAADHVRSTWLTDKMIDNANLALDAAEQVLNTLSNADDLAKDIAARHKELLARAATFSDLDLTPLKQSLPGAFEVLSQIYDDAHPVLPTNFMQVDDSIARVNTALDFSYVRASTTDPKIQGRINIRSGALIQLLGTRDWRSLRAARDLVEQMRQNIYPEDLIEDLRAKKASITLDQQVARPYSPLELCICFSRYGYNHANALEQLRCAWTFDDGLSEKGWDVCHFYQEPAKKIITAKIPLSVTSLPVVTPANEPAPSAAPSATQSEAEATLSKEILVREAPTSFSKQERFATGFRFAIAFFFALVGLLSGARDQLAKLDLLPALIAVFLLGFGADTVKNILTRQAAQPTPSSGR
jgi:hypothetical protein